MCSWVYRRGTRVTVTDNGYGASLILNPQVRVYKRSTVVLTFKPVVIFIPLWVEYQRLGKTVVEKRLSPI